MRRLRADNFLIALVLLLTSIPSTAICQVASDMLDLVDEARTPDDLRDAVKLLNTVSRSVAETEQERERVISEFDPLATPRALLQTRFVPTDRHFMKKTKWWPVFVDGRLHDSGGLDACVVRYQAEGYTFQIAESREQAVFFVRSDGNAFDMTPLSKDCSLPSGFAAVFVPRAFENSRCQWIKKGVLRHGAEIRWSAISGLSIPESCVGTPYDGQAFWTDSLLVLRLTKMYGHVAVPSLLVNKPLFVPLAHRNPLGEEAVILQELEKGGAASIEKTVEILADQMALLPTDPGEIERQSLTDNELFQARRRLIARSYTILARLVRECAMEEAEAGRRQWKALDAAFVMHPLFRQETRTLARALVEAMRISDSAGRRIAETVLFSGTNPGKQKSRVRLYLEADTKLFGEVMEGYLKALPEPECRRICLAELETAVDTNATPVVLLFFMRGLRRPLDPPEVRVLRSVLMTSKDEAVRAAAVRQISRWITDDADSRQTIINDLSARLQDLNPQVRQDALRAIGQGGDVRQIGRTARLLDATDTQTREAALRATASLLGWNLPRDLNPATFQQQIERAKQASAIVVHALEEAERLASGPQP